METEEEIQNVNVHHGHNIRRTRIEKNIKQDALAALVNMTQPNVSKYEKMRVIEDEMLNRFARALNVPVEYLKTLEEFDCTQLNDAVSISQIMCMTIKIAQWDLQDITTIL